ncbi:rhomboid family intramembrane serine protease [Anaerocolumna sp. MB42-C2]|uniref:rhomboid family intramembrane serine protease n=1 Tax=Anaerocolumna sp. MB42-C2 TaxID=3070997 RepID=UPI0027DFFDB7|nr:rhomboid family intramembrane serine protease [Anaerocolumna sp. MB42-C2]WMJ87092.1 rhomboid family intramembrane serine protease [Anaerocolumna sp. MB42-C2]
MKHKVGRFQYNSPVTLTFALISLGVLLLGNLTNGVSTTLFFCTYKSSWSDPLTYIRLFGHVLGHANWNHFSGNMVLFLVLGPMLEEKYGSNLFLKMIVLTAAVSGIFYMVFYPNSALLGASGIVFMMIVLSSAAGMKEGRIPITLLLVVIIYLGGEAVSSAGTEDGIAHGAHILGGICGAGFGLLVKK